MIKAIAFDAYGTIFDVLSVNRLAEQFYPGRGEEVAALWRVKQIDYTRLRTMSDRYAPFSKVTRDGLNYTLRALGIEATGAQVDRLVAEYDRLAVFADAADGLATLKTLGVPLAILSNGNPAMLEAVVASGGLDGVFDHLLSVDSVRRFKTAPEAYALGPAAFACAPDEILFVSSNCWDACCAAWYGYTVFWINRAGMPLEELDVAPAGTGPTMRDVMAFVTPLLR